MKLIRFLLFIAFALIASQALAEDRIQCSESNHRILCSLIVPDYIERVSHILTNGWENTIQINIALLDKSGENTLMRSRLEATQRCYLDPFESPCLILWKGANHWQRYRNESAFLKAMKHFGIQALTLNNLDPAEYLIQITVQVMASAQKRLSSIRSWFKSGSDSGLSFIANGSLIGSFLGSMAEAAGDDVSETTLVSEPIYIDLSAGTEVDSDSGND